MNTTPTQQLQMASFLMNGDPSILSDTLREAMFAPHSPVLESIDTAYGYGLFVEQGLWTSQGYHEVEMWHHGGNAYGYSSDFYVVPSTGFAISILSSGFAQDYTDTVVAALESAADLPAPTLDPPEWPFDAARLDDHVGSYTDHVNGTFTITRNGDGLDISWPFLETYGYVIPPALVPISDSLWVADLSGYPLTLAFVGTPGTPSEFAANRILVGNRDAQSTSPTTTTGTTGDTGTLSPLPAAPSARRALAPTPTDVELQRARRLQRPR